MIDWRFVMPVYVLAYIFAITRIMSRQFPFELKRTAARDKSKDLDKIVKDQHHDIDEPKSVLVTQDMLNYNTYGDWHAYNTITRRTNFTNKRTEELQLLKIVFDLGLSMYSIDEVAKYMDWISSSNAMVWSWFPFRLEDAELVQPRNYYQDRDTNNFRTGHCINNEKQSMWWGYLKEVQYTGIIPVPILQIIEKILKSDTTVNFFIAAQHNQWSQVLYYDNQFLAMSKRDLTPIIIGRWNSHKVFNNQLGD